ncbi:MAG TPA: protein kinase [Vicinamibacterales bacterium]
MIGKTIGKYRFLEELGRGPLGTVYKATDETLDRDVAVKVLNPELTNSELMKHFQTEATTLARLHHSDIATIHEIQRTDTELLMVMELVKGETLEHLSDRCGPLPPERAAYLVVQVLGALEHAHTVGVVHRDLTPASVMVTEHGGIKVLDFGMSRVAAADQATSDGFVLGPPSYMSPERLAGGEVDGRTDLYSAGVIFYRLLTGHVPFEAATPLEMVQKQLSGVATPLQTYRQDLPGWCQAIVDRAIARVVDDRFPTAEAFRTTLDAAIAEATEATGVYAVVDASGSADPNDLTTAAPVPVTVTAPSAFADAPTVATWTPAPAASSTAMTQLAPTPLPGPVASTPPMAPVPAGTTVVLKRNQFAVVGGLLLALVVGVIVLAVIAFRRPATVIMAPAQTATDAPASSTSSASAANTPSADAPATSASATNPTPPSTPSPPPLEIAPPPLVLPPAASATTSAPAPSKAPAKSPSASVAPAPAAPVGPVRAALVTTPFRFDAHAVVTDGDKRRERDATVVVADGVVTVTEKQKNGKALYAVSVDDVVGVTYSNSRQPLWNSPNGPAEAMKVDGGALGFLKGGRNWFGLQTKDSLLVLRVDDDLVSRVTSGLQERTGLTLQRLVEPKD